MLLRLLANPLDDAAFLRIVNVPRRAIGPQILEQLAALSRAQGSSLLAACRDPKIADRLAPRSRTQLQAFAQVIAEHAAQARFDPVGALRALIQTVGYRAWLRDQSSSA
ncbi:MAG: ATP-dependent DNA helicase Rep, partial [Verrucomicrobiae bacterium]|nr:ATP-dependent DNA helicase Rep [Verrucomicrobiae bacterium]